MVQNGITQVSDLIKDGKGPPGAHGNRRIHWVAGGRPHSIEQYQLPKFFFLKDIATAADFDGDGRSGHTLVQLFDRTNLPLDQLDRTSASSQTLLLRYPRWKVIEAADFDGDGKADLVWYNAFDRE